jgi:hypothetical protein
MSQPTVNLAEGIGFSYQEMGHWFYVLTFPTTGPTLVYDATYDTWHERGIWDSALGYQPIWATCHMFAFGKHYVGSRLDGTVFEQSLRYADDSFTPIRRQRTCPHLNDEHQWVFYSQLEVELEAGQGNTLDPSDIGAAPLMSMRFSDDGGHSYSDWRTQSGGAVGDYKHRSYWPRLGRSQDRVFEIAVTSEVSWRLTGANLRVEPGTGMR